MHFADNPHQVSGDPGLRRQPTQLRGYRHEHARRLSYRSQWTCLKFALHRRDRLAQHPCTSVPQAFKILACKAVFPRFRVKGTLACTQGSSDNVSRPHQLEKRLPGRPDGALGTFDTGVQQYSSRPTQKGFNITAEECTDCTILAEPFRGRIVATIDQLLDQGSGQARAPLQQSI